MARDLIVTGMPRAGTTLLAALIDSSPNAICVSEPGWPVAAAEHAETPDAFVGALVAGYARVRAQLARGEPIDDMRGEDGGPVTNYVGRGVDGARRASVEPGAHLRAAPGGEYLLGVKNNALFLSVLAKLTASPAFDTLALIRHPRDVFASWLDVPFPVSQARLPVGEKFWPELRDLGAMEAPLPRRMALLYELLLQRIVTSGADYLIRYEMMIDQTNDLFGQLRIATGDTGLALRQSHPPSAAVDETINELRNCGTEAKEFYEF